MNGCIPYCDLLTYIYCINTLAMCFYITPYHLQFVGQHQPSSCYNHGYIINECMSKALLEVLNPFYSEAVADELQQVPDQIQEMILSASENDRPFIKMDITLLFVIQLKHLIYH